MAYGQIDPTHLQGDALARWYLRSPSDVEQERQAAAERTYADFFGNQSGSFAQQDATTPDQLRSDLDGAQLGHESDLHPMLAPHSDPGSMSGGSGVSGGGRWAPDQGDPTTITRAFETGQSNGNIQLASGPTKDQCIKQCIPLLERPPNDRNQWDFHKCVNACMDASRRPSPNSAPSVPPPAVPSPHPAPWWMWIPRLIPEAAAVLA